MSSVINPLNNVTRTIGEPVSLELGPEKVMEENLFKFAQQSMSQQDCVAKCCHYYGKLLTEAHCNLSAESQKTIEFYLQDFNIAVDKNSYLILSDKEKLKFAFKNSLGIVLKEKWGAGLAQPFYLILKSRSRVEKAVAAERWAQQFFIGVDYFYKWDDQPQASATSITLLVNIVSTAFDIYSDAIKLQTLKTIIARLQKPPTNFQLLFQESQTKTPLEQINSSQIFYSEDEKTILKAMSIHAQGLSELFPNSTNEKSLLENCVWLKYHLRQVELSTAERVNLYEKIFAES